MGGNGMLITSGYNFEGYDIVNYLGHESVQVVLGTGIFSSFDASISDLLGTRSSAYEDKLNLAEKAGKEKLMEKAGHNGGNAIIGLDIDYTTFTNDVIAVIVGGTIVKVERKMPEKEVKKVCSMEYNTTVPIRILESLIVYQINTDKMFLRLYGKNYSDSKVKGLEVKIKIETIFNDIVEIPEMTFADICESEDKEIVTEYNNLKLENNVFKLIKSVSVQMMKYVTEKNEIIEVAADQYKKIDLTQEQLTDIRKIYGNDAVNRAYKSDSGWVCYCGMENENKEHKCHLCKREVQVEALRPISMNDSAGTFCLYDHIDYIENLKNAKEIYDYLEKLNCTDVYFNGVILAEIKKLVNGERMYGSMKRSAIIKLKELYEKE